MDEQELLRTVPIFAELSDADIASLSKLATRRRYPKDTVVFFENEEGDFFFMILEGRIKVTILGDDGREVILSILGPGDFFGEMALLDDEPRSATVVAVTDLQTLSIAPFNFRSVLKSNASITYKVLLGLCQRLRAVERSLV
jgi:CRP/FNR family transcriptional regulator, cyclic AMP receptor protein